MKRSNLGMTLIEVMVAIAIFAVLGVLSYRAVSAMSISRERMDVEFSRWRSVARALQLLENDLLQIAPRVTGGQGGGLPALVLLRDNEREELRLLRHDGANGGLLTRSYWVAGGQLQLARSNALGEDQQAPAVLLEGVKSLRWRFLIAGQGEMDEIPAAQGGPGSGLPDGVRITLDLQDVGTITRVFALK